MANLFKIEHLFICLNDLFVRSLNLYLPILANWLHYFRFYLVLFNLPIFDF